jgi:hypothetical protein
MNFKYHGRYDVRGLSYQLATQPELWNERPQRLYQSGPFNATDDIWVRWRPENELIGPQSYLEPHFATWYPAWHRLPALQPMVFDLMARLSATHLGGILVTRVPAGREVKPHDDRGSWHAEFYTTKVYVVIENNEHCVNRCGGEEVVMAPGEAWEFDNLVTHSVVNNGQSDRVSAIICMKTEP